MNVKTCMAFVLSMLSSFAFSGTVTEDAATKTLTAFVDSGETFALSDAYCKTLRNNTFTNLVKTGAGTLTLDPANAKGEPNYGMIGSCHIMEGTLKLVKANGWGGNRSYLDKITVFVHNGATYEFAHTSGCTHYEAITVEDGGTIQLDNASQTLTGKMTLNADTTFSGNYGVNFKDGIVDFNGHTLTLSRLTQFNPKTILNPGEVRPTVNNQTVYGPYSYDHFGTNFVLHLPAGCIYRYQSGSYLKGAYTNRCEWTIVGDGNLTMQANFGRFAYHGPIILPTTATFYISPSDNLVDEMVFERPITCGTISKGFLKETVTYFLATNNVTTLTYGAGAIYAQYRKSLPDNLSSITFSDNMASYGPYGQNAIIMGLANAAHPTGWSWAEVKDAFDHYKTIENQSLMIGALPGETAEVTADITDWTPYKFYFGGGGGGTVVFRSDVAATSVNLKNASFKNTSFSIANSDTTTPRTLYFNPGEGGVRFRETCPYTLNATGGNGMYIGNGNSSRGFLGVDSGANLTCSVHLRVPYGQYANGKIELTDGGYLKTSGQLQMGGANAGCNGGLLIRGGKLECASTFRTSYANSNTAFIEMSGGEFLAKSLFMFGSCGGNTAYDAVSQMYIKGGTLNIADATAACGCGTTGIVYQTGGTINVKDQFTLPRSCGSTDLINGRGIATFAGGNAYITNGVRLADRPYSTGAINLNAGGNLSTPQVFRSYPSVQQGEKPYVAGDVTCTRLTNYTNEGVMYFNTKAYVNFNGGKWTIPAASTKTEILGTGYNRADLVNVYAGGLVLDTNGKNVSISAPLLAPTGSGVSAIAVSNDLSVTELKGYFIAPAVTITGDGEGATAVANFDSVNGKVTGITVTCPGWGYTTATATIRYGRDDSSVTSIPLGPVTLAANTSGGITKDGEGTLTLKATNTITGASCVKKGTLKLGVADALPANVQIYMEGGKLSTAAGVSYPANLSFDVGGLDTTSPSVTSYDLADNWPDGVSPTVTNIADGWGVVAKGGVLKYRKVSGLVIIYR